MHHSLKMPCQNIWGSNCQSWIATLQRITQLFSQDTDSVKPTTRRCLPLFYCVLWGWTVHTLKWPLPWWYHDNYPDLLWSWYHCSQYSLALWTMEDASLAVGSPARGVTQQWRWCASLLHVHDQIQNKQGAGEDSHCSRTDMNISWLFVCNGHLIINGPCNPFSGCDSSHSSSLLAPNGLFGPLGRRGMVQSLFCASVRG